LLVQLVKILGKV